MGKKKGIIPFLHSAGTTGALVGAAFCAVWSGQAFSAPTDDADERVSARIEQLTERAAERAQQQASERAAELAAERAEEMALEAAGKLASEPARAVPKGQSSGEASTHGHPYANSGKGSGYAQSAGTPGSFLPEVDDNGYEIAGGERLILVERSALPRLMEAGLRITNLQELDGLGSILIRISAVTSEEQDDLLAELAAVDEHLSVDYNHVYRPGSRHSAVPASTSRYPAEYLDLSSSTGTSPVKIGLIDSAVHTGHEALSQARIVARDFVAYRHDRPQAHGTAIASVLVGKTADYRGVMPNAALYAASVFFTDPAGGETATTSGLVQALNWLVQEKVPVVNMSLTGPPNIILERAIERASQRGLMMVAAVGNHGPAAPPVYPAAYEQVIGITAVNEAHAVYRLANRGRYVEFSAPGVDILCASQDGTYVSRSGTSMAVPFAAAILAEGRSRPTASPAALLQQLRRGAEDLGERGVDPVYGHGLIRRLSKL